jgi:AcrR family transcriptional regulator
VASTSRKSLSTSSDRSRDTRSPAHLERLEQITSVASDFFYHEGYAATDLRRIGEAVGMHVSTLYNYISGKEELLYLIILDGMNEIDAGLDEALSQSNDPVEQLEAALRAHLIHHAKRRHRAWTNHVELRALRGERLESIRAMRRRYEDRWIALIGRGAEAGRIVQRDPRLVMYSLLSVGQSLSRWYHPGTAEELDELVDSLVDIAMHGVLRRPAESAPGQRQ